MLKKFKLKGEFHVLMSQNHNEIFASVDQITDLIMTEFDHNNDVLFIKKDNRVIGLGVSVNSYHHCYKILNSETFDKPLLCTENESDLLVFTPNFKTKSGLTFNMKLDLLNCELTSAQHRFCEFVRQTFEIKGDVEVLFHLKSRLACISVHPDENLNDDFFERV